MPNGMIPIVSDQLERSGGRVFVTFFYRHVRETIVFEIGIPIKLAKRGIAILNLRP